jgi:hypothetical protein
MNSPDPTVPPVPPPAPPVPRPPRRSFRSYFWGSLIGALVLIALYTLVMLWWSYSDGDRAGVLQKFSKRGWICKTWEGEIAMYVVGGVAPQIWEFSVRDDEVARQLQAAIGQQVRLHYAEHRGLPTNCFGETDYFVNRVDVVGPPSFLEAPPRPAVPAEPVAPAYPGARAYPETPAYSEEQAPPPVSPPDVVVGGRPPTQ